MPRVGFEPTISAGERPNTYALDRAATRTGDRFVLVYRNIIIIINIKGWAIWPVPSPELQLLSPTFLLSPDCSLSLWTVLVCFERDSVVWHSLQV